MTEFEHVFDDLYAVAYQVAYRVMGSQEDATDLAQEALARAYARWSKVAGYARPWVARVTGNLAIDQIRKARHRRHLRNGNTLLPKHIAEDHSGDTVERLRLQQALLGLSGRQREVVVLRYIADLPQDTVAQMLGCSLAQCDSTPPGVWLPYERN